MKYKKIVKQEWFLSHRKTPMRNHIYLRSAILARLFLKEQLKEPTAILWTIISPSLLFYLLNYTKKYEQTQHLDYVADSAWFYAYVAASVGLFGFSLYIIGRRESGFIRSFIYTSHSKIIFMTGQFLSYSCIALIYCCIFYVITKNLWNNLDVFELFNIVLRFYACFLIFCSLGLVLTLLPINFTNSNTLFSALLFTMIALGVASPSAPAEGNSMLQLLSSLNPLHVAYKIMRDGLGENIHILLISTAILVCTFLFSMKYLRINPVWNRY
ncbi:ABC transporter permease [Pseudomonas sp. Z2-11]